jgi:hypothetical protein
MELGSWILFYPDLFTDATDALRQIMDRACHLDRGSGVPSGSVADLTF